MSQDIEPGLPYHFQEPNNGAHRICYPVSAQGVLVFHRRGWIGDREIIEYLFRCNLTNTYYWRTADSVKVYTGVQGTEHEQPSDKVEVKA